VNRYERGMVVAAIGVVALALALDLGDDQGHDRGGSRPAGGVERPLSQSEIRRIARRVERMRGLRFKRRVEPLFVDRRRGTRIAREDEKPKDRRELLVDAEELKLLGVLEPRNDLTKIFGAVVEEQVLGFYDPRSRKLVVIEEIGGSRSRALQEITLAHELVHALEDQHFDLPDPTTLGDDRAAAVSAILEGTAVALETEYADRYVGLGDLLGASLAALSGTETKLPEYVERSLLFPYERGEQFVNEFRATGSWKPVNRVLRFRLPRTTEQILHPDKYARGEKPLRIAESPTLRVLGRDWRRLDAASVGEFDVDAIVQQLTGRSGAAAAAGWNGGRFELFRRGPLSIKGCPAPCIARDVASLELAWDSERDQREAAAALRRASERGLDAKRLASGHGIDLWSSRGGAIGLAAGGTRTMLVFAPSASLVARVLRGFDR
jgi:hypothetical protein